MSVSPQIVMADMVETASNSNSLSEQAMRDFGDASGVRLDYVEVLNWGTFHERVGRITPSGETALLTGDNGSGKSTMADAILTLLVPGGSRNYNAASGDTSRRERKEADYVRGVIGTIYDEKTQRDEINALRKAGQHVTILLAVFKKFGTNKSVSLAQILWMKSNNEVGKIHIVEERALTIAGDLLVKDQSSIRDTLRERAIEPIDTFVRYSERFHRLLGLNADRNPMGIFNQTVAVKDITNLTKFMREHMLEDASALSQFDKLKERVRESRETHRMIKMLTEQLAMLETISTHLATRSTAVERLKAIRGMLSSVDFYCDQLELAERQVASRKNCSSLEALSAARAGANASHEAAMVLVRNLEQERDSNKKASSLPAIQAEVRRLEEKVQSARRNLREIEEKVRAVDPNRRIDSAASFSGFIASLPSVHARTIEEHEQAERDYESITLRRAEIKDRGDRLTVEQASLIRRTTNIPEDFMAKRRVILDGLGLEAHQIPYAGELLKVRDTETRWTGAIEHLTRSFALTMLVPHSLKEKVDAFVNEHRMRGRIQYDVIPTSIPLSAPPPSGSVASKLEVKPASGDQGKYLEFRLPRIFDHLCCESTDASWHRADRALTVRGLVKVSERRVKDDSQQIDDRSHWVMGWSNADKLAAVRQALDKVRAEFDQVCGEFDQAQKRLKTLHRRRDAVEALQNANYNYEEFNVAGLSVALEQQKSILSSVLSDPGLKEIAERISGAQKAERQRRKELDDIIGEVAILEKQEAENLAEIDRLNKLTPPADYEVQKILLDQLASTLDLVGVRSKKMREQGSRRLWNDQSEAERLSSSERDKALNKMAEMIKHEGWQHLHEEIGAIPPGELTDEVIQRFAHVQNRIKADDLPKTEEKFRRNLQENVIDELSRFRTSLNTREDEIHKRIRDLNTQLERVDFYRREGQETFIRLKPDRLTDEQVKGFRVQLEAALSNILNIDSDMDAREACYHMVNGLIEDLDAKPAVRDKVIDVRNWFEFKAEECLRQTDGKTVRVKETYRGSTSKSGGEKSRLASTVLATAVAYQYGVEIDRPNAATFRFVLIDEALARIGDSFSEYLFEVFARFHLQLLIINPIDGKLHVAEQYAKRFHVVQKPDRFSSVANMSVSEFQKFRDEAEAKG